MERECKCKCHTDHNFWHTKKMCCEKSNQKFPENKYEDEWGEDETEKPEEEHGESLIDIENNK